MVHRTKNVATINVQQKNIYGLMGDLSHKEKVI